MVRFLTWLRDLLLSVLNGVAKFAMFILLIFVVVAIGALLVLWFSFPKIQPAPRQHRIDFLGAGTLVGGVVPLDVAALMQEIKRWMTDDVLRASAASKARAFVWERYDWRQIARRWGDHYGRIVGRR